MQQPPPRTATLHGQPNDVHHFIESDAHRLGPGWMLATGVVIFLLSLHPIRRWRRARREAGRR